MKKSLYSIASNRLILYSTISIREASNKCFFQARIKIDLPHFADNNLLNSEKTGYCTLMSGAIFFFFAKFGLDRIILHRCYMGT